MSNCNDIDAEPANTCAKSTIGVVIPSFNQARFLADAITSVLLQTHSADEIIVIDDCSTDNPATIVSQFERVKLITQPKNSGPSAARNVGIRLCKTHYIVFLDADDRLLPSALEIGLKCFEERPDCALVHGGFHVISEDGTCTNRNYYFPVGQNAYLSLLRRNQIGPPATAIFRRDCLLKVNGFDEGLRKWEDYDLYLRLAKTFPVVSHPAFVAEHRRHSHNSTNNHAEMLKVGLHLFDFRGTNDPVIRAALKERRRYMLDHFVPKMLASAAARWHETHNVRALLTDLAFAAQCSPRATVRASATALYRAIHTKLGRSRLIKSRKTN
jgi:glycosyltransferase involved in cell wall biosynthesis